MKLLNMSPCLKQRKVRKNKQDNFVQWSPHAVEVYFIQTRDPCLQSNAGGATQDSSIGRTNMHLSWPRGQGLKLLQNIISCMKRLHYFVDSHAHHTSTTAADVLPRLRKAWISWIKVSELQAVAISVSHINVNPTHGNA